MKLFLSASIMFVFVLTLAATQAKAEGDWNYSLTPYVWLPTLGGELKYAIPAGSGGSPNVESGPNSYLENLDFAFMLAGEARKGKWLIFGDFIYLNFVGSNAKTLSVNLPGGVTVPVVDAGTTSGISGVLVTLAPGYSVYNAPELNVDLFGGVRHMGASVDASWRITGPVGAFPAAGSISQNVDLWDAIIGVRGRINLGESQWTLPYYVDVGSGSSNFTWQASAGISYGFSWGDLRFSYRHLEYDLGSNKLLQNLSFSGPVLGATYKF